MVESKLDKFKNEFFVNIDNKFKVMKLDIDFEFGIYKKEIDFFLEFIKFIFICLESLENKERV